MRKVSYEINGKPATFEEAENCYEAKTVLTEVRKNSKAKEMQLVIANLKKALDWGQKIFLKNAWQTESKML